MNLLRDVALAVLLFASTNIDDVFVLLAFFSNSRFKSRQIILGQYLALGALVLVSVVASLLSLILAAPYIGLLGLLPIAIGIRNLIALRHPEAKPDERSGGNLGKVLTVTAVTLANGGDNIAVYTPYFATCTAAAIVITLLTFTLMIALWIGLACWLSHHPRIGTPIRKAGHIITPIVLIALGLFVLWKSGLIAGRMGW